MDDINMVPDPMGQAIYDYHNGKKRDNIIHVDSNITEDEEIPVHYLFRSYQEMPVLEKTALSLCKGKILDVGAGSGCHSIVMQELGKDVSALEKSVLAIMVLKERGIKKIICHDIFDLQGKYYDTILMLMNGIGLCGNLEGLNTLLMKLPRILNPGGQLIFDSSDISYMYPKEDQQILFHDHDQYYGELSYVLKYEKIIGHPFNWLFIDYSTLEYFANRAGYKCELIQEGSHFDYLARIVI